MPLTTSKVWASALPPNIVRPPRPLDAPLTRLPRRPSSPPQRRHPSIPKAPDPSAHTAQRRTDALRAPSVLIVGLRPSTRTHEDRRRTHGQKHGRRATGLGLRSHDARTYDDEGMETTVLGGGTGVQRGRKYGTRHMQALHVHPKIHIWSNIISQCIACLA